MLHSAKYTNKINQKFYILPNIIVLQCRMYCSEMYSKFYVVAQNRVFECSICYNKLWWKARAGPELNKCNKYKEKQARTRGEAANRFSTHAMLPPCHGATNVPCAHNKLPSTNGNVPSEHSIYCRPIIGICSRTSLLTRILVKCIGRS